MSPRFDTMTADDWLVVAFGVYMTVVIGHALFKGRL